MPHHPRIVIPGVPHHITQRGNHRDLVFLTVDDRLIYLDLLKHYAMKHGLELWAYCLMTTHVHLIGVPASVESLARTLRDTHRRYALRFNSENGGVGHLWQGRFFSCGLDEHHLWASVRYVEQNPVRAGMARRAQEYRWSSARAHCGLADDSLLSNRFPPPGVVEDWLVWLSLDEDEEDLERIRRVTITGRPCGSDSFLDQIEKKLGRPVRPGKRGRKSTREE